MKIRYFIKNLNSITMQIKYSAIIDIFQLYQRDLCKTPPFAQFRRQAQILILKILKCISACPACPVAPADGTGVVKIFAFLGLEPRLNSKNRFNWAGKIERFPTVSYEAGKLRVLKFTHLQLY